MNISVPEPLVKKLTPSGAGGSPSPPGCQHPGNVKRRLLPQLSAYFSFQRRALYIAAALQSLRNPYWSMCKPITLQYDTWDGEGGEGDGGTAVLPASMLQEGSVSP